jgi:FkbM family methyltransferase
LEEVEVLLFGTMIRRTFPLVAIYAVACFSVLFPVHKGIQKLYSQVPSMKMPNKERLADGCYHVFLDVGANIGVHGRFLFEPKKYPNSKVAANHFNNEFERERDNRDFCVFAFEPNPAHKARLELVASAYRSMGWRYEFIPAAVGDQDGTMTFHHMNDETHSEWGFTSLPKNGTGVRVGKPELVPVVRLASWILDHVHDRFVPTPFGNYKSGPKVVMKMDVEGTEFAMLPDLIVSGALCSTVDLVFGEFHYSNKFYPMHFEKQGLHFNDSTTSRSFQNAAIKLIEASQSCKTKVDHGPDDETYLLDGMPLPSSAQ